jgi:hypothetical protein
MIATNIINLYKTKIDYIKKKKKKWFRLFTHSKLI